MNKILNTTLAAILFCTAASADNSTKTYTVTVAYDGTKAVVSIPEAITDYVSCPSGESSHVKLLQTSTTEKNPGEIIYSLSGQSDNGEFYLTGEYKATLQLNGLTLANPDSSAVHIKDGKRIKEEKTISVYMPPFKHGGIGRINNVFGGGYGADVDGDTYVRVGTREGETITFATGPNKTAQGAIITGNIFGGGNAAEVTGDSHVTIGKQ